MEVFVGVDSAWAKVFIMVGLWVIGGVVMGTAAVAAAE